MISNTRITNTKRAFALAKIEAFSAEGGGPPGCGAVRRFDSFSFGVARTGSTVIFSGMFRIL